MSIIAEIFAIQQNNAVAKGEYLSLPHWAIDLLRLNSQGPKDLQRRQV